MTKTRESYDIARRRCGWYSIVRRRVDTPRAVRRRDGQLAWRKVQVGPMGGQTLLWAPRIPGEKQPSAWAIWSRRLRDVSMGDVVGDASGLRSPA
jgi:GH43 family beta-xylosidase